VVEVALPSDDNSWALFCNSTEFKPTHLVSYSRCEILNSIREIVNFARLALSISFGRIKRFHLDVAKDFIWTIFWVTLGRYD